PTRYFETSSPSAVTACPVAGADHQPRLRGQEEEDMKLVPTEEQSELRSVLRSVFTKQCPPALVRAWKDPDAAFPDTLWRALADLGVFGLVLPEEFSGAGATLNELGIAYS